MCAKEKLSVMLPCRTKITVAVVDYPTDYVDLEVEEVGSPVGTLHDVMRRVVGEMVGRNETMGSSIDLFHLSINKGSLPLLIAFLQRLNAAVAEEDHRVC